MSDPVPPSNPSVPYTNPNAARDLGFGDQVAGNSRRRLLNRDGQFNLARQGLGFGRSHSAFHALLTMRWGTFLLFMAGSYAAINAIFAAVYVATGSRELDGPNLIGASPMFGPFLRAFFFSVETFSTIGYGHVAPIGLAANVTSTVEAFVGLFCVAIITGIVFARFSRPLADILYSNHAVIAPYRDHTGFMVRCANVRRAQLIDVSARLIYSRIEERDGVRMRLFTVLPLEFDRVSFFALTWTIVHPIDVTSPLHGKSESDLHTNDAEFLLFLSGTEETFSQTVHSRMSYKPDEMVWNAKFTPIFVESHELGTTGMDISRIHEIRRLDS